MATAAAPAHTSTPEIPNKLYFRIGDVSKLAGVKQHVLRFWETEFPGLHPRKSGTNQRLYRRKDVELVLEIKHLLYEKRFTIEGARTDLQQHRQKGPKPAPMRQAARQAALFAGATPDAGRLREIREELRDLLKLLS
jgi:DNA-binding transcriptional MerR regulator